MPGSLIQNTPPFSTPLLWRGIKGEVKKTGAFAPARPAPRRPEV
jgi:hypothetical protein